MDIKSFAEKAKSVADRKIEIDLGGVNNHELIKHATGFDLTGFRRILDNYGVRHTLKSHGNEKKEAARGQIAVTSADFELIPIIASSPDRVFHDGTNKVGCDVIVFTKVIAGIGYRHVEEIRGRHKLVAADSMRRRMGRVIPPAPATSACRLSAPSLNVLNDFAGTG